MNPKKQEDIGIIISKHRVIVPVYIPSAEGYYINAFTSLKICLNSLFQTLPKTSVITVINNECSTEVSGFLYELFEEKKIQQLILNSSNKGKVEAVLDVFRNSHEDLVTITDCDVLFKQGWLYETKKVFWAFPKVGFVSPLPLPNNCNYYSKWSWFYGLTSRKIIREGNSDRESLNLFNESILVPREHSSIEEKPFKLKNKGTTAVIGAGHFCGTYNKNIKEKIPYKFSGNVFKGAEDLFLDKPIEDSGFLRLATDKGYVYHISINPKAWMNKVMEQNEKEEVKDMDLKISSKGYNNFNFFATMIMKERLKYLRYKIVKKNE